MSVNGFMVFNAIFNNISVISWWSVLLLLKTGVPWVSVKLYHIILYTLTLTGFELTTLVVIGTGCIYSCKFNYHAITLTLGQSMWFWDCISSTIDMTVVSTERCSHCITLTFQIKYRNRTFLNIVSNPL